MKNYYDILGVPQNATERAIKLRFRELAKKYHPDLHQNKEYEKTFQEITEAYEVLSDPDKRAKFDLRLSLGLKSRSYSHSGRTTVSHFDVFYQIKNKWIIKHQPFSLTVLINTIADELLLNNNADFELLGSIQKNTFESTDNQTYTEFTFTLLPKTFGRRTLPRMKIYINDNWQTFLSEKKVAVHLRPKRKRRVKPPWLMLVIIFLPAIILSFFMEDLKKQQEEEKRKKYRQSIITAEELVRHQLLVDFPEFKKEVLDQSIYMEGSIYQCKDETTDSEVYAMPEFHFYINPPSSENQLNRGMIVGYSQQGDNRFQMEYLFYPTEPYSMKQWDEDALQVITSTTSNQKEIINLCYDPSSGTFLKETVQVE